MLKMIAIECLKHNFPQLNRKTQIIETDFPRIEISEETTPELRAAEKETYFSRLFKALLNKNIEPFVIYQTKENVRELCFEYLDFGYRHVRETLIVCYDNVSDVLYVNRYGYTDIDLNLLSEL